MDTFRIEINESPGVEIGDVVKAWENHFRWGEEWPMKIPAAVFAARAEAGARIKNRPALPPPADQMFTEREWLDHHGFETMDEAKRHYAPTLFPWEELAGVPLKAGSSESLARGPGYWSPLTWLEYADGESPKPWKGKR